jgi:hypothetical protein
MYLPVWSEINESRYFADPDVEKLLLELETCLSNISYLLLVIVFVYKRGLLINTVRTPTLFRV